MLDGVPLLVSVLNPEGVRLSVPVGVNDAVGEAVLDGVLLSVPLRVPVGVNDADGEAVLDGVPLPEPAPVGEGVAATDGEGEGGRHALPQDRSSTKPGGHMGVSARTECKSIT